LFVAFPEFEFTNFFEWFSNELIRRDAFCFNWNFEKILRT
jgi:hypothetical protein